MIRTVTAQVKAVSVDDGLEDGQFTGYASVFNNLDSYGDVVVKGAFDETLAAWKDSGNALPCLWGHDFGNPESNIGWVLEASEDEHGLLVKVQLDLESDRAKTVHRLLKGRRVAEMSFAYEVLDASWSKSEELGDYYELRKLKLYEVSVVPIGANSATEILTVKAGAEAARHLAGRVEAGKSLTPTNETELRKAYEAIGSVLEALGDSEPGKASGEEPAAKDSGPAPDAPVPSEPPTPTPSVDAWAAHLSLIELEGTS